MNNCFWKSGCANSKRCNEYGSCIAREQKKLLEADQPISDLAEQVQNYLEPDYYLSNIHKRRAMCEELIALVEPVIRDKAQSELLSTLRDEVSGLLVDYKGYDPELDTHNGAIDQVLNLLNKP